MARLVKRLSARQVSNAKPKRGQSAVVIADGGNLFLQCSTAKDGHVRRSWLFKYELNGRRREMGLGPTHTVSLGEARETARQFRRQLIDSIDPLEVKDAQTKQRRLDIAKQMTFGQCVDAYLETHDSAWKNEKHRAQWKMTLTKYCTAISDLPVKDIDTDLVLRVLTPLWKTKTETAKRLRGRIERVLSWAKGRSLRSGENPARWQGHLDEMLAKPSKVSRVRHHPALPYSEIGTFMAELRRRVSLSAQALEFTILTGVRTSETIGALWSEIDLDAKTWIIPAERMKMGREHRVPLSDRAVAILRGLTRHGDRVFKLSNMGMLQQVRGLRTGLTVHGFRSTFRDWAAERTNFPNHVTEQALAHAIGDRVEAAYRRGDLFDKRRKLMDAWATYCAKPPEAPVGAAGNVTPMRRKAEAST
jgi:integrase